MKVSVIIPSRLQINSRDPDGKLWLNRALEAVLTQSIIDDLEWEIVVGLDPSKSPPTGSFPVKWVNASMPSQANAVNAAVDASSGELLAFLEDDDYWLPDRLEYGLSCLDQCELVTSNQTEVTDDGAFVRINDCPTPSGWLLRRKTWKSLGPFDATYRFHLDTEYLGRINAAGLRRIHLVEAGAGRRPWLDHVSRFSQILQTKHAKPLVERTVNPGGGMSLIRRDALAGQQSQKEYQRLAKRYGTIPW